MTETKPLSWEELKPGMICVDQYNNERDIVEVGEIALVYKHKGAVGALTRVHYDRSPFYPLDPPRCFFCGRSIDGDVWLVHIKAGHPVEACYDCHTKRQTPPDDEAYERAAKDSDKRTKHMRQTPPEDRWTTHLRTLREDMYVNRKVDYRAIDTLCDIITAIQALEETLETHVKWHCGNGCEPDDAIHGVEEQSKTEEGLE